VHAALSLVMTLFGVAVLFIEQEADFLAAVQIIVYAGAIVVLFLFVIMFLGVDRPRTSPLRTAGRPAPPRHRHASLDHPGRRHGHAGHVRTGSPGPSRWSDPFEGHIAGPTSPSGEPAQLGKQLFTTYLFAFEATARCWSSPWSAPSSLARGARRRRAGRWQDESTAERGCRHEPVRRLVHRPGRHVCSVLIMFMCIELMLNAANLTFVTFARMLNDIGGQAIVFFVLVVAAAEVVVGLGIVVTNFRRRSSTVADDLHSLKG
jgi:NADH-quinone oxidoreductase subunit K